MKTPEIILNESQKDHKYMWCVIILERSFDEKI